MTKKDDIKINIRDKVLFVHHWDCDGLCSVVLLHKLLNETNPGIKIKTMMPEIGNYFLSENVLDNIEKIGPRHLFIIDMALPESNILLLKKSIKNIYIFDHHKQARINRVIHINPTIDKRADSFYPSTGWVLNDFFNKEQDIFSILGAIGDQGGKVKNNSTIKKVLKKNSLDFSQGSSIVEVIDSNYILNNEDDINKILSFLRENKGSIGSILQNKGQARNRSKIEKEITGQVNKGLIENREDKIIIKKFNSRFNIISGLARALASQFPGYIIVAINNTKKINNIYFRSSKEKIDLTPIIGLAKKNNYNAGGKNEVVGVFLPKEDVPVFLKEAFGSLGIDFRE